LIIRYSLINAIVLFNLAMVVVALLRHKTSYLARYTTTALMSLLLFGAIRIFIPISIPYVTFVVNSYDLFPYIESFLRLDVMPGNSRFELQNALLAIWIVGIVVAGLRTVQKIKLFRFIHKTYNVIDNMRESQMARNLNMKRVNITVSSDVSVPYVTGVLRAKIYLPPLVLTDSELEMILRHEYQHFKSGDALIKRFYLFLSIVFWWNPFTHIFLRDLDCLLEIRCDAAMSKNMTHDEKARYLRTLLSIYRRSSNGFESVGASTLFRTNNEKLIVQRFKLITSENKSFVRQFLSVMMVVFLFLASYMVIFQPFYPISPEYEGSVFAITPENSLIVLTAEGIYRIYIDGVFFGELTEITIPFDGLPIVDESR